jgi:acyl-CoA thioester hydrolase
MSKIFTRTFRVRWSEVDATGSVRASHYLRYLVETALDWGATGQLGADDISALGQVWVIRQTDLTFFQPLQYNDLFDFTIWLVQWRRVRGTRAFELTHKESGNVLAQGVQQVVCLDGQTLRPTRPPQHVLEYFEIDHPRTFPQQRFPRVPPAPKVAFVMQRRVENQDVDQDGIVNNATYVDYAEEAAARALDEAGWPPGRLKSEGFALRPRRLHIQYQSPASWGDQLQVATYLLQLGANGGVWHVAVQHAPEGAVAAECLLDWRIVDRVGREARPLPGSLTDALRAHLAVIP